MSAASNPTTNIQRSDQSVERNVRAHADKDDSRHAQLRGKDDDQRAGKTGNGITNAGNLSDQRVQADTNTGAGQPNAPVQDVREESCRSHVSLSVTMVEHCFYGTTACLAM